MHADWQHLVSSAHLAAALDLDGTLIPFAPTPAEAVVEGEAAALLQELATLPQVTVGVISGRPLALVEDLADRFPNVLFAAEHGVWRRAGPDWHLALQPVQQLDEIEQALTQLARRHPGALVERKSCSVCLHWRRVDPDQHDRITAAAEVIVDEWLETHHQLERLPEVAALEVRHRAAHKGSALTWLRERAAPNATLLAIGDDITDEDMFVSLREGDVGILVADRPRRTQAGLRLPSPAAVHRFLRWLIDARRSQPTLAPAELELARIPLQRRVAPHLVVVSNRLPAAPNATAVSGWPVAGPADTGQLPPVAGQPVAGQPVAGQPDIAQLAARPAAGQPDIVQVVDNATLVGDSPSRHAGTSSTSSTSSTSPSSSTNGHAARRADASIDGRAIGARNDASATGEREALRGDASTATGERAALRGDASTATGERAALRGDASTATGERAALRPTVPSTRQREVGGLVSALLPALAESSGIWLGWSGAEREPGLRLRVEDGESFARAEFDYPSGWRQLFYAGFCNQSLWPLLHSFPSRVRYVDDEWACYVDANRAYAQMVLEAGGRDADVWVQDFHLMLVARELRRAGHTGRLGFYLHVPFPALDVFETMPWATEVMAALLDYDRIGLQSQRWYENFLANARGLLGADAETRVRDRVQIIPVGIDPDRFAEASGTAAEGSDLGSFEAMYAGRKLILGVDRLDYSKGIPERLEAFARLLERFPEWRGKVSFVQVSVPTRSEVPEYAELRSRVEALVGRINGAFGEADWTPVRYLYRSYDQATLARLYRLATICLVTPLRDGMNLVAKEYVASQDSADPGVLVLSRFCGAAEHMQLALITNPYHVDGVASDLDTALRMPLDERVARHGALRAVVWQETAAAWAKTFLDALRHHH